MHCSGDCTCEKLVQKEVPHNCSRHGCQLHVSKNDAFNWFKWGGKITAEALFEI